MTSGTCTTCNHNRVTHTDQYNGVTTHCRNGLCGCFWFDAPKVVTKVAGVQEMANAMQALVKKREGRELRKQASIDALCRDIRANKISGEHRRQLLNALNALQL